MICAHLSKSTPYNFNKNDQIHQFNAVAWVLYVVEVIQNRESNSSKENGAGFEQQWNRTCEKVREAFRLRQQRKRNQGPSMSSATVSSGATSVPRQGLATAPPATPTQHQRLSGGTVGSSSTSTSSSLRQPAIVAATPARSVTASSSSTSCRVRPQRTFASASVSASSSSSTPAQNSVAKVPSAQPEIEAEFPPHFDSPADQSLADEYWPLLDRNGRLTVVHHWRFHQTLTEPLMQSLANTRATNLSSVPTSDTGKTNQTKNENETGNENGKEKEKAKKIEKILFKKKKF
jgi:hypothetical protein